MISEFSPAFGDRVKRVMAESGLSADRVEQISERKISHMTVRRMSRGHVPSSDLIIEFAETVGRHREMSLPERQKLANDLLAEVGSRARYASVMLALAV